MRYPSFFFLIADILWELLMRWSKHKNNYHANSYATIVHSFLKIAWLLAWKFCIDFAWYMKVIGLIYEAHLEETMPRRRRHTDDGLTISTTSLESLTPTLNRFAEDTSMLGFRYLHTRYKTWFRLSSISTFISSHFRYVFNFYLV